MINLDKSVALEEYVDCGTIGAWDEVLNAAKTDSTIKKKGLEGIHKLARDHARTPMQWTADAPHGGFSSTTGKTWMRANDSFATINVAQQELDPESPLAFYRTLLQLRKALPELVIHGLFELVDRDNQQTFTFIKWGGEQAMVVALNFTTEPQPFTLPESMAGKVKLGVSSLGKGGVVLGNLRPFEAQIFLPL